VGAHRIAADAERQATPYPAFSDVAARDYRTRLVSPDHSGRRVV
jgi:hypothetical protein